MNQDSRLTEAELARLWVATLRVGRALTSPSTNELSQEDIAEVLEIVPKVIREARILRAERDEVILQRKIERRMALILGPWRYPALIQWN
jgi:hypothetical protein